MGISGHEIARVLGDGAVAGAYTVRDPGTGGTINIGNASFGVCELVLAAAGETRTLPAAAAMKTGVHLFVVVRSTAATYSVNISNGSAVELYSKSGDIAHYVTFYNGTAVVWGNVTTGRPFGVSANPLVDLATSTTLTAAAHANRTLILTGTGSAFTQTLPAAASTGNIYRFIVGAVNTSNHIITTASVLLGHLVTKTASESNDVAQIWNAAEGTTITLNGTTKGGALAGDWIEFIDYRDDKYLVRGVTSSSGTEVTPFS